MKGENDAAQAKLINQIISLIKERPCTVGTLAKQLKITYSIATTATMNMANVYEEDNGLLRLMEEAR